MTLSVLNRPADLGSLIGSRICHDLISPIGAINNGLELLAMSGGAEGPEIGLIGESVGSASARIRFFRVAFGAAGDQMVGSAEAVAILRDLYTTSRLDIDWQIGAAQPRSHVRISFLAILCLETAMPYGGTLTVQEDKRGWLLTGTADRINAAPELWSVLAGVPSNNGLQPSHLQFALLPLVAQEHDCKVVSRFEDRRIEMRF
jgi:histidine phosphotransferase ChpT